VPKLIIAHFALAIGCFHCATNSFLVKRITLFMKARVYRNLAGKVPKIKKTIDHQQWILFSKNRILTQVTN